MSLDNYDVYEAQATYSTFKAAERGWAPYCTSEELEAENMEVLVDFGRANFAGALQAFRLLGAWQIAFAQCKDQLRADEAHPRHPSRVAAENEKRNAASEAAAFRSRVQAMSSFQIKEAGVREPSFKERYAALVAGERTRL